MVSCEDDKSKIVGLIAGDVSGFMVIPFNPITLKKTVTYSITKISCFLREVSKVLCFFKLEIISLCLFFL